MFAILARWFKAAWQRRSVTAVRCDELTGELADARAELDKEKRRNSVLEAELETYAAVFERNRKRIEAEIGLYAAQVASTEQPRATTPWTQRNSES